MLPSREAIVMTARGHSGDASRSLASKRLFVYLYRVVILAIGVGILAGLASFVVEHVNGAVQSFAGAVLPGNGLVRDRYGHHRIAADGAQRHART